ncbi:restriction endonuclease subunit S [Mycoplasma sp. Sp33II]|uniref:restriction endonuclease subunit S n=1 Tax=unclassified Mycoplasma TaxID=2683645 RepID=UPI003AB0F596
MHAKKLVPQIRFKGFEEEWRYKILNELANKFDNLRIPVSEKLRKAGDIPYYGANGIQDYVSGYTHDGEFVLVAEDGANDLNNYPSKYVNGKFWANNHVHVIQGKENILDNKFLSFAIKNFNFKPLLTGGDRSKLNASALDIIQIKNPSIKEQEKIGLLFSSLDSLITSQELKPQKLQAIKQSLLDKMFASNNEKVPKIRFKGFREDWKENKIGYFLCIPVQEKANVTNASQLLTLGLNLSGLKSGSPKSKLNFGATNYFLRKDGQFIYGKQNFFNGSMAIITAEFHDKATSKDVPSFNIKNIDNWFFYYFLARPNYYEKTESLSIGTGSKRIHEDVLFDLFIMHPLENDEQVKIAKLIKSINSLIMHVELKLEKLNNIKQGLLEKMFC